MADATPAGPRRGPLGAGALGCLLLCARPVVAHPGGQPSANGVGLRIVLPVIVGLGLSAGALVALGCARLADVRRARLLGRAVGPLLIGLGGVAVVAALLQRPVAAVGSGSVGLLAGGAVVARGGCGVCADVTTGAIAVHRFVEGLALAALAVTGASISVAGVVVLAGHTVVECVAVAGQQARDPLPAVGAVAGILTAFVLGVGVGTVGLGVGVPLPEPLVGAVVGGLLLALGMGELRPSTGNTTGEYTSV